MKRRSGFKNQGSARNGRHSGTSQALKSGNAHTSATPPTPIAASSAA
jgi:hypothetical protein